MHEMNGSNVDALMDPNDENDENDENDNNDNIENRNNRPQGRRAMYSALDVLLYPLNKVTKN